MAWRAKDNFRSLWIDGRLWANTGPPIESFVHSTLKLNLYPRCPDCQKIGRSICLASAITPPTKFFNFPGLKVIVLIGGKVSRSITWSRSLISLQNLIQRRSIYDIDNGCSNLVHLFQSNFQGPSLHNEFVQIQWLLLSNKLGIKMPNESSD